MKRFNINNYSMNRESIIDLPDIHHSLIIIPEKLFENSESTSTGSATFYLNNKSTPSIYDIKEEDEEEEEEKVVESNEKDIPEVNNKESKVREVNVDEEKSKYFTEIDLFETKLEQT